MTRRWPRFIVTMLCLFTITTLETAECAWVMWIQPTTF
jgi:hypothetical protein